MTHRNSFPGFVQHPNNRGAHISINRPDPQEKQKTRSLESEMATLKEKMEKLEKLLAAKLGE